MGIEQKVEGPKTVIAVVGDTGAGKSSLMNALLDHRSVLPTSGIRACTAVVVEVIQNNNSDMLEADIEFLQRRVLINSCHAECFYLIHSFPSFILFTCSILVRMIFSQWKTV